MHTHTHTHTHTPIPVYDSGTVFDPSILDITDDDLLRRFLEGVSKVAAVSLQIGYPTVASVPYSMVNGFKNLLAVAVATDITFKEAEQVKMHVLYCYLLWPVIITLEIV